MFFGQSLLLLLGARKRSNFFNNSTDPMGANKSRILCFGSSLEENFDLRSTKKKGITYQKKKLKRRGWTSPNICNLCKVEEKSTNHILHYAETRIL